MDHTAISPIIEAAPIQPTRTARAPLGRAPGALVSKDGLVRFVHFSRVMSDSNLCINLDYMDSVIGEHLPLPVARELVVHEFEKRYLRAMLTRHGSVADAARQSGIALRYFQLLRKRRAP